MNKNFSTKKRMFLIDPSIWIRSFRFFRVLFLFPLILHAQYEDTGKRGIYFPKKQYVEVSIPSFKENRSALPSPIIDSAPEYTELYWKAWSLA
ncbi:MAG: hypothetical protein KA247_01705, partial [Bacteroidetes bacterium]|nr:hypothetical protein [Bacteroidota bacterium]